MIFFTISVLRQFDLGQAGGGGFPLRGEPAEVFEHLFDFEIDFHRPPGVGVGFRFLQLSRQLGLAGFEGGNFLFQPMDHLPLLAVRAGARLPLLSLKPFLLPPFLRRAGQQVETV